MYKRIMLLCYCFVWVLINAQTQPQLPRGWERINIENVGSFDIPPTMELQSSGYRSFKEDMFTLLQIGSPTFQIVVQQKGQNEFGQDQDSRRYARVMFKTEPGDRELTLDFDIREITTTDIRELNDMFRQSFSQSGALGPGQRLVQWYPLKIERINGMSCIHINYKRQLNNNEPVIVHNYMFMNYDRTHTLIMSYREVDKEYWESDFQKILASLRIRKRR